MRPLFSLVFKLGLIVAAVLPLETVLRADGAPAAPTDPKPIYVVWRAVGFENTLADYYVKSGGKDISLEIPAFAASAEYAYAGPNPMAIYRKSQTASPDKPPVPVALIHFDPSWKHALVFVYPRADGTLGARTAPNDKENFKSDSLRVFNLTNQSILLKINDEEQVLKPVQVAIVEAKNQAQSMPVRYAFQEKGVWVWKGSNYFSIRQGTRRTVVLIHTDAAHFRAIGSDGATSAPSALQVFSFSEQCAPAEKAPKGK